MFTLSQWKENKALQEEYETMYRSPVFQYLKDVLIDAMLASEPALNKEASVLEVEAMRGVFRLGQQQMIKNLDLLRPAKTLENNNVKGELPKTPTGLPYTPEIEERVRRSMPPIPEKKPKK